LQVDDAEHAAPSVASVAGQSAALGGGAVGREPHPAAPPNADTDHRPLVHSAIWLQPGLTSPPYSQICPSIEHGVFGPAAVSCFHGTSAGHPAVDARMAPLPSASMARPAVDVFFEQAAALTAPANIRRRKTGLVSRWFMRG